MEAKATKATPSENMTCNIKNDLYLILPTSNDFKNV
jgi:hypothetical protein